MLYDLRCGWWLALEALRRLLRSAPKLEKARQVPELRKPGGGT
jgi:hypothetical protein